MRIALRDLDAAQAEVLAELRYDLPPSYAFHRQRSTDIAVDLWRFGLAVRWARKRWLCCVCALCSYYNVLPRLFICIADVCWDQDIVTLIIAQV